MTSVQNVVYVGQRLWFEDRPATLVSKDCAFVGTYINHITYSYRIRFNDRQGGSLTLDESKEWDLYRSVVYNENSEFELGDTMEIKRDGLEPNLRGRLLEIDENAERWPYRVGAEVGNSVWFSWYELTKIHSVLSRERSPRALEVLKKQIAEKREELEALETALEVLEYATT